MKQGILVGTDQRQEWLLPWWWEALRRHSNHPVAFVDFGMSAEARLWCQERGNLIDFIPPSLKKPSSQKRKVWNSCYSETFWASRPAWFCKPFALRQTPFEKTLWLDLDCEVCAPLDALFSLGKRGEMAMLPEKANIQEAHYLKQFLRLDETLYNAGVIVYTREAPLLKAWIAEVEAHGHEVPTEQHALAQAMRKYQLPCCPLPEPYNQLRPWLTHEPAVIKHWIMEEGKACIRKKIEFAEALSWRSLKEGVIVGCDAQMEWMLPWWWMHYSLHNTHPVTFIDLGMTSQGIQWCLRHGELYRLPVGNHFVDGADKVAPYDISLWNQGYGDQFWPYRAAWFKKPLLMLKSPYERTIWIDIDCEVKGSIASLFDYADHPSGMSVAEEDPQVQATNQLLERYLPGETSYTSGVLVYRRHSPLLQEWAEKSLVSNRFFIGDQNLLSRLIFEGKWKFPVLPSIYNWNMRMGENSESVIDHWPGSWGKQKIQERLRQLQALPFVSSLFL